MMLRTSGPGNGHYCGGIGRLPGRELDRLVREGADEWSELQDALVSTGGMLPQPILVARLGRFIRELYWEAEAARVEALRRQRIFDGMGRRPVGDGGLA
jgi:hypothetical protein